MKQRARAALSEQPRAGGAARSSSGLTPAGVGVAALGGLPGQVVVEVVTALAVHPLGVVVAHAPAVHLKGKGQRGAGQKAPGRAAGSIAHHSLHIGPDPADGGALGGMAVAEAVPAHHQLIHGVIVLLLDLQPGVQQVVSQRVEPSKVHPQVGDLQQV